MPPIKAIIEIPAEIRYGLEERGMREHLFAKLKLKDITRQLPSQGINAEFDEKESIIRYLNTLAYNGKFHSEEELRTYVLNYLIEKGFTKEGLGL